MDIVKIAAVGEKLGYSGERLKEFIEHEERKAEEKEKQQIEREERKQERDERKEREEREKKREEKEKEREEKEKEREKEREEKEKEREEKEKERVEDEKNHRRDLEKKEMELAILRLKAALSEKEATEQVAIAHASAPRPKLPKFEEKEDDMDAFLERFERYAQVQKWDMNDWAVSLSPLLTGKGLQVYTSMPADDINDYHKLKVALLKRYQLTADGFQKKFRESLPETGETVFQYIARLSRYFQRWIELSGVQNTYEALMDLMIREQYISICSVDLAIFLRERVPENLTEMTKLAEQYMEAHRMEYEADSKRYRASVKAAVAQDCSSAKQPSQAATRQAQFGERRCFICQRSNHIARDCFFRDSNRRRTGGTGHVDYRNEQDYHRHGEGEQKGSSIIEDQPTWINRQPDTKMPVCDGFLNGKKVEVLRDTGCSSAAVRKKLVPEEQMTDRVNTCVLIDGTERRFQLAQVQVDTPYFRGQVEAMVMDNPVYDFILGNVPGVRGSPDMKWRVQGNAVTTRAQAEKEKKPLKPLKVPIGVNKSLSDKDIDVHSMEQYAGQGDTETEQMEDCLRAYNALYIRDKSRVFNDAMTQQMTPESKGDLKMKEENKVQNFDQHAEIHNTTCHSTCLEIRKKLDQLLDTFKAIMFDHLQTEDSCGRTSTHLKAEKACSESTTAFENCTTDGVIQNTNDCDAQSQKIGNLLGEVPETENNEVDDNAQEKEEIHGEKDVQMIADSLNATQTNAEQHEMLQTMNERLIHGVKEMLKLKDQIKQRLEAKKNKYKNLEVTNKGQDNVGTDYMSRLN